MVSYACRGLEVSIEDEKFFTFEVYPLLETKCFSCHANDPDEIEGEYNMLSKRGLLDGGESGHQAVIVGDAEASPLYQAILRLDEDFAMPPKSDDKLDEEQVSILKKWINSGAAYVDESRRKELFSEGDYQAEGMIQVATSGGTTDSWTNRSYKIKDLWAYMPLKEVDTPIALKEGDNPIDAFVNQRLKEHNIIPAGRADKATLLRRLSFDVIGLPPSKEDMDLFINESDEDGWGKIVDRYLGSPQYGVHWGKHWLDVTRYADSDGFANDYIRPHAWRYRDYVVRSFNNDKPYDQFVKEQIAGDELDADNPENLIATGYLRMGPWEQTGMSIEAVNRQFYLDDASHNIGEVFLAQPLNCARCHDHKYDPVPTRDVYSVQATLANTRFADRPAAFLDDENLSGMEQRRDRIVALIDKTERETKRINQKYENAVRKWYNEKGKPYKNKKERRILADSEKPRSLYGLTDQELGYRKLLDKRRQRYRRELAKFDPMAYSVYNGPHRTIKSHNQILVPENLDGDLTKSYILTGGSVYAKADEVEPGILSVLPAMQRDFSNEKQSISLETSIPNTLNNRRLALANWITQADNPLSSRVIVNRIWQYHFGKGIAENTNNFGGTGKKPTHPELLDWLAIYFVENGWSIKKLHRLILNSETWQRSGTHPEWEHVKDIDPDNKYLSYYSPRRLDADEIRDAALFVSGELNTELGGLPIRPEIHQEVAMQPRHVMGSVAPAYQPSPTPTERNRRTIYTERMRGLQNPLLEVFNQPTPDMSCERRSSSTVTPQVFMLFNDQFVRDRGVAIAAKVTENIDDVKEQIEKVFNFIYNRETSKDEMVKAKSYISAMKKYHMETPSPAREYPRSIEREMFEEMTGAHFTFSEELDIYNNYIPDLHMDDISPDTRALADLAVVLINSNEFMYVY